ncbi:hypothetical protein GQ44DRAFT_772855 [Phaeosphaeriaceae sp. PMI808]|nr:hypothetical protein GQ44DRAFT_772855 [Phaeosphaeriaceae sp. PMI808]
MHYLYKLISVLCAQSHEAEVAQKGNIKLTIIPTWKSLLSSPAQQSGEMPPSRRPTDPALERARAAQRRPTLPYEAKTGRIQEKFPAYDDFPWSKIEEFLRQKWPEWNNFNPTRSNSYWQFEVPKNLDENDKNALRELRDAPKRSRRASVSEEE